MEAEAFKLIRERKKVKKLDWNQIADEINKECGTDVNGEQIKDFVQRGVIPFGGWLEDALEYILEIPRRHPKVKISFKGGGSDE